MDNQFNSLRATRLNLLKLTEDLTIDQLNEIPEHFRNNLIWNLGHVVVTQQLLCYRMSDLPCKVSDEMIDKYRKGSHPEGSVGAEEIDAIKALMLSTVEEMQKDFAAGIFKTYKPYMTSYNVELNSAADALMFNNIHEGLHFGYSIGLKKLIV